MILEYFFAVALTKMISGPAGAPPSVPKNAFGDERNFILLEPMGYVIGDTNDFIIVPAGFVTDLASIPQAFWSMGLTPQGQYSRAAIIHDYLYWSQKCTRDQADRLLVVAMKESQVGTFDQKVIYEGVHLGGQSAWEQNASEKRQGKPRILPPDWRYPPPPNINWDDYRKKAIEAGVVEEAVFDRGAYCHYGDSLDVPQRSK